FWNYVSRHYGYNREEKTLKTLFIHLIMTAATRSINEEHLIAYNSFIAKENQTNAYVFVDHWMNHRKDQLTYNNYIKSIEQELKVSEIINELPIDEYVNSEVFPFVDQAIISYIGNRLKDDQEDFEHYLTLIQTRRTKHFYQTFRPIYEALHYAIKIYEFKHKYKHGIPKDQSSRMYDAYAEEYYLVDYYYRKFYGAFDEENQDELLQEIKTLIEYIYKDWFVKELNIHWSQAVHENLAENWSLPAIDQQQKFYSTHVAPHINNDERVFVIIS